MWQGRVGSLGKGTLPLPSRIQTRPSGRGWGRVTWLVPAHTPSPRQDQDRTHTPYTPSLSSSREDMDRTYPTPRPPSSEWRTHVKRLFSLVLWYSNRNEELFIHWMSFSEAILLDRIKSRCVWRHSRERSSTNVCASWIRTAPSPGSHRRTSRWCTVGGRVASLYVDSMLCNCHFCDFW